MRLLLAAILVSLSLVVASSALAQQPGAPTGSPCFALFELREGTVEQFPFEHTGPLPLGCPVFAGYVVLLDSADPALRQDPRNWSDVVAFTTGGPVNPGQPTDAVYFISDSPDPTTGVENGMQSADLAVAGLSVADILGNSTTVYLVEGANAPPANPDLNPYDAISPTGVVNHYNFYSDPPEGPTPTQPNTWGRIKALYR